MKVESILNAQERKWQAEGDARTLAESEKIRLDKKRLKNATEAAKRMAEEDRKRSSYKANRCRQKDYFFR